MSPVTLLASTLLLVAPGPAMGVGSPDDPCSLAMSFVVDEVGMAALSEPDTIDDWRTRQVVEGCRVTAAGLTARSLQAEATLFYERLREAGWTRTPDPRDAPNEASLRFRMAEVDCLFNFYSGQLLGTEAEAAVGSERVPKQGQQRFNFLVLCIPAMDAAQRGERHDSS